MNVLRKNKPNPKWVGVEWREEAEAEAEERAKQQAEHARLAAIARQPSKIVRKFLRRWQEFIKTCFEGKAP